MKTNEPFSDPFIPKVSSWKYPLFEQVEFTPKRTKYCVCVFILNENGRIQRQLEKMKKVHSLADVIIADGGSKDGSTDISVLTQFGVRSLLTKRGSGKLGSQMRMAFAFALTQGYEGVIVVDGNDKDDVVDALPLMIAKLDQGYDHVQGSRYIPGGHHENTPVLRHLAVKWLHAPLISWVSKFRYTDTTNGFRAYSRKLLEDPTVCIFREELSGYELHYYLAIESARQGFRVCEVPVTRVYPANEKTPTKISFFRGNFKVLMVLFKAASGAYRLK